MMLSSAGHRVTLTTLAAAVLVAVHMTFAQPTFRQPLVLAMYVPLIGQGVAYSIYSSSLWPSIPLTVEQHEVKTTATTTAAAPTLILWPLCSSPPARPRACACWPGTLSRPPPCRALKALHRATVWQVGMAYGVATAIQNGGLAAFPIVIAAIKTASGGYVPWVEYFFVGAHSMRPRA